MNQILSSNTLYDGPTSPTTWNVANFGSTHAYGCRPPSWWTVGAEFQTNSGMFALSQANGSAIWIASAAWAGFSNAYAEATLIHEIIHKFGLSDGQMGNALGVSVTGPGGSTTLSDALSVCVQ